MTERGEEYDAAVDWEDTHEVERRQGQGQATPPDLAVLQDPGHQRSGQVQIVDDGPWQTSKHDRLQPQLGHLKSSMTATSQLCSGSNKSKCIKQSAPRARPLLLLFSFLLSENKIQMILKTVS